MKEISGNSPVYIIAEIGMNHDGDFQKAAEHIDAAGLSGADAVKFQMHIPEAEMLPLAPAPAYFNQEPRWEYFNRTAFSIRQWEQLIAKTHQRRMDFVISAFSEQAVELCSELGIDCFKIASGEVNNIFLLNAVNKTNIPVILSSGMSTLQELDQAVKILASKRVLRAVLQCSSKYPCVPRDAGLNVMLHFMSRYPDTAVGLSDHTLKNYASFAAVSWGAKVIERHFTLSKEAYGPDAKFSLLPDELRELVGGIRCIEEIAASKVDKDDIQTYKEMRRVFCKSIVAKEKITKGERLIYSKLTAKKPADGLLPTELSVILNKVAKRDIAKDEIIFSGDVE